MAKPTTWRDYRRNYNGSTQWIRTTALKLNDLECLSGSNESSSTIHAECPDAPIWSLYLSSTWKLFQKTSSDTWKQIISDMSQPITEISLNDISILSWDNSTSESIHTEYSTAPVWSLYISTTWKLFKKVSSSVREEIPSDLYRTEKVLTSSDVLDLNWTPIQIIPAPWAWKAIIVEKVIASIDFNSAVYATNTDLEIKYDNATAGDAGWNEVTMASLDAILLANADTINVVSWLWQADETSLAINKWVTAKVATGNPTAWDSPLKLVVFYRIVTL